MSVYTYNDPGPDIGWTCIGLCECCGRDRLEVTPHIVEQDLSVVWICARCHDDWHHLRHFFPAKRNPANV